MTSYELAYRLRAAARQPASWWQLLKFGLVGGLGYLINLAVFDVLVKNFGVYHLLAATCAFCVAVSNNFLWNRYWTFEPGEGHPAFQAARFFAVSLVGLGINLAVLALLLATTSISELAAQAVAVAVAVPFNFLGNKLWTFV